MENEEELTDVEADNGGKAAMGGNGIHDSIIQF